MNAEDIIKMYKKQKIKQVFNHINEAIFVTKNKYIFVEDVRVPKMLNQIPTEKVNIINDEDEWFALCKNFGVKE